MNRDAPYWAILVVLLASIGFGLVPLFARDLVEAGLSSALITFARYSFSAVLLLPFLKWRRVSLWALASGVALGIGYVGYVSALKTVPVATAGVLYMTYPLFTLLLGMIFFRDPPSQSAVFASLAVLAAALIVAIPKGLSANYEWRALLSILSAPIGFAIAINVLTHKLESLSPLSRVAATALGSVMSLAPFIWFTQSYIPIPRGGEWLGLALLALTTAFIPQILYTIGVPKIGASSAAVLGSIELPTMFLIGFFAYGDPISATEIIAGGIVVLTMIFSQTRRTRGVRLNLVEPQPPRAVEDIREPKP